MPGHTPRTFAVPTIYHEIDPRLCTFCEESLSGSRSREHIFPKWLLQTRNIVNDGFQITWASDVDDKLFGQRNLSLGSFVAGRVCRRCNNGWMSQLEQQIKELLSALMEAERQVAELSGFERESLARWATKTAFAYRSADLAPHLVDPRHAHDLAANRMPPVRVVARQASVELGLGCYATQRWMIDYPSPQRHVVETLTGHSHKTVLVLGHLLIAVCYWPEPTWPLVVSRRSHTPLWPLDAWLTYDYPTDRHGVPPSTETEVIDMVVGTRIAHPTCQDGFFPVASASF